MNKKNTMLPFSLASIYDVLEEFNNVEQFLRNKKAYPNYPPSNIHINTTDNSYVIQFAVAGWSSEELHVIAESDNKLIISGDERSNNNQENIDSLHQGIALRKFIREFSFSQSIENVDVQLENGILSVTITFKELNKTKTFEINTKKGK